MWACGGSRRGEGAPFAWPLFLQHHLEGGRGEEKGPLERSGCEDPVQVALARGQPVPVCDWIRRLGWWVRPEAHRQVVLPGGSAEKSRSGDSEQVC